MALEFQIQQAPMRFGLAEGVDPHQVPFGTLMTAENACWTRTGTLGKRKGISSMSRSISGGGTLASASRLITRGSELSVTDGSTLYTQATDGTWISRGRHPELGLTWSPMRDTVSSIKCFDVAYLTAGQIVHAWVEGDPTQMGVTGNLFYQIVDATTGAVISAPQALDVGSAYRIRVVSDGTNWAILWLSGANLKCRIGSTTSTLKTDAMSFSVDYASLDACMIGANFVVAYALAAGGIRLVSYNFTPTQQQTSIVTGETSIQITSLSVAGAAGEAVYVGYCAADARKFAFAVANPTTLVQTVAPVSVDTLAVGTTPLKAAVGLARETSTSCVFLYSFCTAYNKSQPAGVTKSTSITSTGGTTTGQTNFFLRLLSRPFFVNGRPYALLGQWTLADTFLFLTSAISGSDTIVVDVTVDNSSAPAPCRQVGKIGCLIGGVWGPGYVCSPAVVSSTKTIFPHPYMSNGASSYGAWRQGVQLVSATVGTSLPADMWRPVTIGSEAYLGAGVLTAYDGLEANPYGWAVAPQIDQANSSSVAGGGALDVGTYIYNVTAERRSATGILYRSPVGVPFTVSQPGAGTGHTTLSIVPLSMGYSARTAGIIPIYRTVVGGTIPQRLTIEPRYAVFPNSAYSSQPITVIDDHSDVDIGNGIKLATRAALYTAGGELEDFQPPSALTHCFHQNRIWLLSGDGRTVWISKDVTVNPTIAPGFHPTVILLFEKTLTALASMDEKLIAFAADTFWFVIGNGPTPNGQNGDYQINRVQTDVGCINPRSVVSTPDGIMFQSSRGLYLLTRGLELIWIGRPVKDELVSYPNVTSAVLVAAKSEIRFTANNAAGTAGIGLTFNYVEKQWTTAKYTVGGVYDAPIADALIWEDKYTAVSTSGYVFFENDASNLDDTTWVPFIIETAWVSAQGPLAYQSVRNFWIEGISNSNHDLTLSVAFDNATSYAQTKTYLAGSTVTSIGPLEECGISIGTRRKCGSIRFKLQDATPTSPGTYPVTTGQGPSFDMLGIEVGLKKGFRRLPAVQTG